MPPPDEIHCTVNGAERAVTAAPGRSLLSVLREELGLTGAKYGCGEGACGVCTVLVDGEPVRACTQPVGDVAGRSIETIEGLSAGDHLHPVAAAFLEAGAFQCGYCTPGMIMACAALLRRSPHPTTAETVDALNGNACRCGTYGRILKAVGLAQAPAPPTPRVPPPAAVELPTPRRPWDLTPVEERDYFDVLPPGLVMVLGPPTLAPGHWSTSGGAWIHIGGDGQVTAFTGKVEVGQDTRTALTLLVADELRVQPGSVRLVMGDTDLCPYDAGTFGSRSMVDSGSALRATAGAAREYLLEMAAEAWGASPGDLEAAGGRVRPVTAPDRSLSYGELVARRPQVAAATWARALTPPAAWTIAAQSMHNTRGAEIVTGTKPFVTDLHRPGMLAGAVLRPPSTAATLRAVDAGAARALPGVTVVHEGSFVGVAAPDAARAEEALQAIKAEWEEPDQPSDQDLVTYLRANPTQGQGWDGAMEDEVGNVERALADEAIRVEATYTTAYLAHVPMETRVAIAEMSDDRFTIWVATQRPFSVRAEVAATLGVTEERVRIIMPDTGTGFGGKHTPEVAIEAAHLARAAGRPVKVRWSSPEEFTAAYFRPAAVIDVRSAARADGTLTAWDVLNLNAGTPGIRPPYDIPHQRVAYRPAASPLKQGSYRALGATANHFARESHMDELAHRLGIDPVEFRLRHLSDERLATVLTTAAEHLGWSTGATGSGSGLGLACGVEKDSRVATGASVRVHSGGRLEILRLVSVFEAGAAVHPDNLANQIEGAAVMGLGGALFEAVHFRRGAVTNGAFSRYRVPRFADLPPIEVVLIDRPDLEPAGGGETPIVVVAPALANAIFRATGRRLRSMPLAPDGVVPAASPEVPG